MMKWTFIIQQRHKVAALLASVMALIILTVLLERKYISDINKSVTSIYNDRLVPAADIFQLAEQFYSKRFLLEKYLITDKANMDSLKAQLADHDKQIFRLIKKYEKTFLVNDESLGLKEVKAQIKLYNSLEDAVIEVAADQSKKSAFGLYETAAKPVFAATINQLTKLSDVQIEVGSDLLKRSAGIAASSRILSTVQIVLAVIIGMMIVALVNTSRMVSSTSTNYKLN